MAANKLLRWQRRSSKSALSGGGGMGKTKPNLNHLHPGDQISRWLILNNVTYLTYLCNGLNLSMQLKLHNKLYNTWSLFYNVAN